MDQALKDALNQSDVNETLISALEHADLTMRKYIWRGFKPKASPATKELIVDGNAANDFVQKALERLCSGVRTYDSTRTLLENLNSVTDSLIWSDKKSADRTGVIDFPPAPEGAECLPNPIESKAAKTANPAESILSAEYLSDQAKCFQMLRASFDGDSEMQGYLDALSEEYYKPEDIAELTGIPIHKIYEMRRKLKKYTKRLFGVLNFSDLKRKLENPENESETKSAN